MALEIGRIVEIGNACAGIGLSDSGRLRLGTRAGNAIRSPIAKVRKCLAVFSL